MKHTRTISAVRRCFQPLFVSVAFLALLLMSPDQLVAQAPDTVKAVEAEEEVSLISPSMQFSSVQKGDNTIDLKAAMNAKINGAFKQFPFLKVKFIQVTEEGDKELGAVITDRTGNAVFNCKPELLATTIDGKLNFKAVFSGNKSMEAAEEELTITRARLEIVPIKEDSLLSVKVRLVDLSTGQEVPVSETAVGVFVARLFRPLKVGEGTTDENGEAIVEIPNELPGNAKGDITLLAKLDENETFGNMEAAVVQPWGVAVSDKLNELPRALWSKHPPLWMMITFIILMVTVWGHYIVIIVELFRLRKEEPHAATT